MSVVARISELLEILVHGKEFLLRIHNRHGCALLKLQCPFEVLPWATYVSHTFLLDDLDCQLPECFELLQLVCRAPYFFDQRRDVPLVLVPPQVNTNAVVAHVATRAALRIWQVPPPHVHRLAIQWIPVRVAAVAEFALATIWKPFRQASLLQDLAACAQASGRTPGSCCAPDTIRQDHLLPTELGREAFTDAAHAGLAPLP